MDKFFRNQFAIRNFSSDSESDRPFEEEYSLEMKQKFIEICKADLMSRVLDKKNKKDNVLLKSDLIVNEFVDNVYSVYTGQSYARLSVKKNMVGLKVGEFIVSKKNKKYRKKSLSPHKLSKEEKKRRKALRAEREKEEIAAKARAAVYVEKLFKNLI